MKEKIYQALRKKAKEMTTDELKEKVKITRQTHLDMLYTFQDSKIIAIGEEMLEIFQEELKTRKVIYNGKDDKFLEIYYGLAAAIANNDEDFKNILRIIKEDIE